MILTGNEITKRVGMGDIVIDPFIPENVNPNSYNFRLHHELVVYDQDVIDPAVKSLTRTLQIPFEGLVLEPQRLYLASTVEKMGSEHFVPTYAARSSVARLGMFINLSAPLGDIGFIGRWTIQLYCLHRVRVYPGMNIGQMMFWHVRGEINLYEGKYQNADRVIASRIFKDFHKKLGALPYEGQPLAVTGVKALLYRKLTMSGKYNQLIKLSAHLPVPALTAVTEQDLTVWWENYGVMRSAIERILTTIKVTSSAFLDEHLDELAEATRPIWHPEAEQLLAARLRAAGLEFEGPLAVRSSCSVEDAYEHSYAGLFVTRLNVQGVQALRQAIEDVWGSSFGRAALIERLRSDSLTSLGEMTVILQRMVPAVWAGVAFSHDPVSREPVCIVEAVSGCGDKLVSGESRGVRARVDGNSIAPQQDADLSVLFRSVAGLVQQVMAVEGGEPTDVEWAYDGKQLWLLQARHITTVGSTLDVDTPVCEIVPLYAATDAEIEKFRPLPDFANYFRSKRKPMADFATRMGLPAATSLLIRANRAGLSDDVGVQLMRRFKQPQQLLDLSSRVRQLAVPNELVIARLRELLGQAAGTFVLRDFVRGLGGLITQVADRSTGELEVLCEWSLEGLLAINRGTASTVNFMLDAQGEVKISGNLIAAPNMTREQKILLFEATQQAQIEFGRVQLEWVSDGDQLYIIDYSLLDTVGTPPEEDGTRIISAGYANGLPVVVDASRDIEQLSIAASVSLTDIPSPTAMGALIAQLYERIRTQDGPVIVVSPRPYAALAPLIPFAAGFVFEQASTLCHLAILLREHGVPAIESLPLYQQAISSKTQRLTLDSSSLAS